MSKILRSTPRLVPIQSSILIGVLIKWHLIHTSRRRHLVVSLGAIKYNLLKQIRQREDLPYLNLRKELLTLT
jgi:hypothetical protein